MSKKCVLIVTSSLQPAGAEKYAFELAKAFNKDDFQVELLTTNDVHINKTFPHVYFPILKSLGFKIHTLFNKPKEWIVQFPEFISKNTLLLKLFSYPIYLVNKWRIEILYTQKVKKLYNKFDAILLIDALHYRKIAAYLPKSVYFETHLMCHQVQFDENVNIYEGYQNDDDNNFVFIDSLQLEEIKRKKISVKNSYYFPLSLDIPNINLSKEVAGSIISKQKNIAVFTRISRMKPLGKIIDAFELLCQYDETVHLKLFGVIQDKDYYEELMILINKKGLAKKISFEGHSVNMVESIREHDILLLWVISIYSFVGYAATEVCLHKVPIILNNIERGSNTLPLDNAHSLPPYFYSEQELAQFTFSVLSNTKSLGNLAEKQYCYYVANNNIVKNISKYENYLKTNLQ